MKILNIIRKTLKLPFALVALILIIPIGFFATDWENDWDVKFYKKMIKELIW